MAVINLKRPDNRAPTDKQLEYLELLMTEADEQDVLDYYKKISGIKASNMERILDLVTFSQASEMIGWLKESENG